MAKNTLGWPPSGEPPPVKMRVRHDSPVATTDGLLQYLFVPDGFVSDYDLQYVWMPEIDRWCTETIGPAAEAWGRIGTVYYIYTQAGATAFKMRWR